MWEQSALLGDAVAALSLTIFSVLISILPKLLVAGKFSQYVPAKKSLKINS